MESQKNIRLVIRVIIVLALLFQLSRLDQLVVGNYQTEEPKLDLSQLNTPKLENHFDSDDDFGVYYSSTDEDSLIFKKFFDQSLKDTKKRYLIQDLDQNSNVDYSKKQIIILVNDLNKIADLGGLSDYIQNGGRVMFAQALDINTGFYTIYRDLGINEVGQSTINEGFEIEPGLFPGYPGGKLASKEFKNYSLSVGLDPSCKIYMHSLSGTPLLWTYNSGAGKVVIYNGTIMLDKVSVGLIMRCLALMQDKYIYPIINSEVVFLDDYPAPFPNGNNASIRRDYDKNIKDFYLEVWWPDMLELANRFGLKYTAVLIDTYNNKTKPPFDSNASLTLQELVVLGKEVIRNGGELGLHGYNHQSLTMDKWRSDELGYNYWKSQSDMVAALKVVNGRMKEAFPKYDVGVYVPPSNVISEEGLNAIHEAIPSMKVISSVFYEDYIGLNYTQNFSVDKRGFINFPRFSSGYDDSDFNNWSIINGVAGYGVFSHFIHPDDFLDPKRNKGKNWEGMEDELEGILKTVHEHYPWLRPHTASEGADATLKYLALDYSVDYTDKKIEIHSNAVKMPYYMILKSEHKPTKTNHCTVKAIDDLNYFVTVESQDASIEVAGD